HQVFNISPAANVEISGLTIMGGNAVNGGGISNSGTLLLSDDVLTGNTAAAYGGGIYNTGALTLTSGLIINNVATTAGSGIYSTSNGSLHLLSSTVADNNYSFAPGVTVTAVAPDIYGKVDSGSSRNLIGVGDGNMTGISNGDANHNMVGTPAAPNNPFL